MTYRAYGNVVRALVQEIDNPIRFQGQYHDPETGLHYNRHRYYNPNTGRFLTPDPIGLAGGLNNYQYVPNPTGWVDPLGLVSQSKNSPEQSDSKADFYVGPDGPNATLPSTGYRYMDSSYTQQTISSGQAPLSYFGFTEFRSGQEARDAYQIYYKAGDPNSWSDARLLGQFDTLQLFDSNGVPRVEVPKERGGQGPGLEPFANSYPEYGSGGEQQLKPNERMWVRFDQIRLLPETANDQ